MEEGRHPHLRLARLRGAKREPEVRLYRHGTKLSRERRDVPPNIAVRGLVRRLAAELGVGAMTIYHHVPSKEDIIDGMV